MSPIDYNTLAISYNLLIFVLSFWSSMSILEICLAASSREITLFQLINKPMNYLHKTPRDFSFLDFFSSKISFGEPSSESEMI
jgi:hypothetical protein